MRQFVNAKSVKYNTNSVMVDVEYTKEYIDYWHGTENPRGIYLTLVPVNVQDCGGYNSWESTVGSGIRCVLKELKRKSQKQINICEEAVKQVAEEMATAFAEGDDKKVREMMRQIINTLN